MNSTEWRENDVGTLMATLNTTKAELRKAHDLLRVDIAYLEHRISCAIHRGYSETNIAPNHSKVEFEYDLNKKCTCGLDDLKTRIRALIGG